MKYCKHNIKLLPFVPEPKYVVLTDFDETYLAHKNTDKHKSDIKELEEYLLNETDHKQIFFGWVTGSSLTSVFEKINKCGLRLLPHFIASSLGTEITYFNQNQYGEKDQIWEENLMNSNFSQQLVNDLVSCLQLENVHLTPQPEIEHSPFLKNYYYYQQDDLLDHQAILKIKELVTKAGIQVNISQANPLCGDPENCYDVDFTPSRTGKKDIVNFILNQTNVSHENSIAFGESGNDIKMLQTVRHGYLVKNATSEAKKLHSQIAEYEYAKGILFVLKTLIQ
ncbi:HAD-IIB family hydrolase [Dolichospermum circinale]|uniref:HAD-IIB family hydrolase n=1 Tax=Dolichospermum circinale TaxID=109265 RepID=UPI00040E8A03|nr:HAD-IIB family hydrolase [Dolichospermum circinale]MDB9475053.1 HAD-IIB family hydrolase [Dolichospermum circinale CS-537/11]MDB9480049.1 HAD-IIB family hydrolase [Dolichospermum circinale CS-537/03]MDB9483788.1 HAD-IIB family hydrolase [Dolichospermum circinale CS-537/05]